MSARVGFALVAAAVVSCSVRQIRSSRERDVCSLLTARLRGDSFESELLREQVRDALTEGSLDAVPVLVSERAMADGKLVGRVEMSGSVCEGTPFRPTSRAALERESEVLFLDLEETEGGIRYSVTHGIGDPDDPAKDGVFLDGVVAGVARPVDSGWEFSPANWSEEID